MDEATIEHIPLAELKIDQRYQRTLNKSRVAKIAKNFEPALCGPLEVSRGKNGAYAVFDGQHRLEALRLMGETEWPCRVHNLTPKEQAATFVRVQTERRPVQPLERHKAAVFAGDELAIKVNNLAEEEGYRITQATVHGSLACVAMLYLCYQNYGPASLRGALRTIDAVWGKDDHYARKGPIVSGMALFIARYGDEIDMESFVKKLRSHDSAKVLRSAVAARSMGVAGISTDRVMVATQLVAIYNSGRRVPTEEEEALGTRTKRLSPARLSRT